MENVIIIGNHAVAQDLVRQYEAMGCRVLRKDAAQAAGVDINDFDEACLLTGAAAADRMGEDGRALALLEQIAEGYDLPRHGGRRLRCHLLLQSPTMLRALQQTDFQEAVNERLEVYPFTMEDCWGKNVLVHLPGIASDFPMADREPITAGSRERAHIVVCGFDRQAEAVVVNAALTLHFPNYRSTDAAPIRTRITVVSPDVRARSRELVACYQHLFDHSFYRTVDVGARSTEVHRPLYDGRRKEFVDVEWEFVEGDATHEAVRQKLAAWCADRRQHLSIFVSGGDEERDLALSMSLPWQVYESGVPVFVHQERKAVADALRRTSQYGRIYPFGMKDCGYDVTLPLVGMAKLLNYFYACSYGDVGVPTELPAALVEQEWQKLSSLRMRLSNIYHVMTLTTKMHSLGHTPDDAATFYALTREEIEQIAATEHNRWSVERLLQGVRPCTDEESQAIRQNIADIIAFDKGELPGNAPRPENLKRKLRERCHFDLRAYEDLEVDATGKNVQVYDYDLTAAIPLIVKTYFEDNRHGNE